MPVVVAIGIYPWQQNSLCTAGHLCAAEASVPLSMCSLFWALMSMMTLQNNILILQFFLTGSKAIIYLTISSRVETPQFLCRLIKMVWAEDLYIFPIIHLPCVFHAYKHRLIFDWLCSSLQWKAMHGPLSVSHGLSTVVSIIPDTRVLSVTGLFMAQLCMTQRPRVLNSHGHQRSP